MSDVLAEVTKLMFSERANEVKHPTFEREISLHLLISEGKLEQVKEHMAKAPKSDAKERGILSDNPLRNAKYHMVAMTALVSRICILKGMPQDISYKISDAYIKKADESTDIDDVHNIQWEMVKNYTEYMNSLTYSSATSKQIRDSVDYIRQNIHDNITVAELAEKVDLNETYLSKLFKKEMGCTVSEYIRNEKIEEACYLLRYTDKTSIEIASDLSFSSHSYFISVFKKVKGVTPKEYRNYNSGQVFDDME